MVARLYCGSELLTGGPEWKQLRREHLRHQEYDQISITEDVPALGIEEGDEGILRGLTLHNETVFAFVAITYSTDQRMGDRGAQAPEEGSFV